MPRPCQIPPTPPAAAAGNPPLTLRASSAQVTLVHLGPSAVLRSAPHRRWQTASPGKAEAAAAAAAEPSAEGLHVRSLNAVSQARGGVGAAGPLSPQGTPGVPPPRAARSQHSWALPGVLRHVLLDSACAAQPARGGAQLGGGDQQRGGAQLGGGDQQRVFGGKGAERAPGAKVAPGAACFATFFPGLAAQVPVAPRRRAPAPRARLGAEPAVSVRTKNLRTNTRRAPADLDTDLTGLPPRRRWRSTRRSPRCSPRSHRRRHRLRRNPRRARLQRSACRRSRT